MAGPSGCPLQGDAMRMHFWLMFLATELFVLPGAGAQEYTLKVSDTIPVQTYGSEPYISPIADFDGDGYKDFVAGVSLYLGRGDGRFLGRRLFEEPVRPTGAGDVDGDVNPDLVVVSPWYTRAVIGSGEPRELQILRNERDAGGKVVFRKIKSWPGVSFLKKRRSIHCSSRSWQSLRTSMTLASLTSWHWV